MHIPGVDLAVGSVDLAVETAPSSAQKERPKVQKVSLR